MERDGGCTKCMCVCAEKAEKSTERTERPSGTTGVVYGHAMMVSTEGGKKNAKGSVFLSPKNEGIFSTKATSSVVFFFAFKIGVFLSTKKGGIFSTKATSAVVFFFAFNRPLAIFNCTKALRTNYSHLFLRVNSVT